MAVVNYRVISGVARIEIDNPPVNALSQAVRAGVAEALARAAADPGVAALVLSGARGTFSAGADLHEVASGEAMAPPLASELQAALEASRKPVVAALEGHALGGGLELALACHFRIGAPGCRLGLPEVKLGLIPGAGGTLRFTRLAGPEAALESLTSGVALTAPRALELGLLDAVAEPLAEEALTFARAAVDEARPLKLAAQLKSRLSAGTPELFARFRERLAGRLRGQLAPALIVDCIEAACTQDAAEALARERAAFLRCRDSEQHRALTHLFFAERAARKVPDIPPGTEPLPVRSAAVIGAGTMGGGIAMCFANAGIPVSVLELNAEALERGLQQVRRNYAASVSRGSLSQGQADAALACIRGVTEYPSLAGADIVIEAVFESLPVKKDVFAALDAVAREGAILATNTSTLDIDAIAAATRRPGAVVGTHFFSPAHIMKLMENVRGPRTDPQVIASVMALGTRLGKVPVLAGNCDGFIGNRMLGFYGLEAEFLLEEGATPEQVDRVMEEFGFAMGPLAVRDLAGNDVGFMIRKNRRLPADERFSPILERMVAAGRLGQKSGRGFYRYEGRTRIADPEVVALIEEVSRERGIVRRRLGDEEIRDRLLAPLVNEGARIVEEGIALRPGDVDVVYVNGYGFPAWRGGPMHWGQVSGLARLIATLERLAPTHGERWGPSAALRRAAATGAFGRAP
ncbi:MAG: enoyl-CoA hydratase/isomerase family protein [Proteobacteria bacterium]|nr:enoyl-CoA hydratase/isomerase family protein [Pseudomonadota bacterium]